mmetsp:Transcript_10058/g.23518  ORF Transcript_10058/g.23518 Transcript_10058/m.23518 type:complete len:183 (-) Transcript_10058:550-1098(-)
MDQTTDGVPSEDQLADVDSGGSSSGLTQGERIFVSLLTLFVAFVLLLATYAVCTRRRAKRAQKKAHEMALQRRSLGLANEGGLGNGMAHSTPDGDLPAFGGRPRQGRSSSTGDIAADGSRQMASKSWHGTKSKSSRSLTDGNHGRRRSSSAGRAGGNVSKKYRLAAINHMNEISATGRHGGS